MATTKKAQNSSKTAHVMNLLSKSNAPTSEDGPEGGSEWEASSSPSVMASPQLDLEAAAQIKVALEGALEEEERNNELEAAAEQEVPAESEAPAEPEAPVESEAPAEPEAPVELEASAEPEAPVELEGPAEAEASVEPEASAEPEAPAGQDASAGSEASAGPAADSTPAAPPAAETPVEAPTEKAEDPDLGYVNVMQILVEEKAPKYIKMFGLCPCQRCAIDVKAIALNNLMPKYVVMGKGETVPRLSVYEGRYDAEITMQILRACNMVKDTPRH